MFPLVAVVQICALFCHQTKNTPHFHEKHLVWMMEQNPNRFVEELIEIGGFSNSLQHESNLLTKSEIDMFTL